MSTDRDHDPHRAAVRLAHEQITEAEDDLHDDSGVAPPRYPYVGLHALAGALAPGRVTVVAANSGQGKTTFALDLLDKLASPPGSALFHKPVYFLGLEQKPKELRTKWACLRADVHAKHAFDKDWETIPGGLDLRARVADEFGKQRTAPLVERVLFDPTQLIDQAKLAKAGERARAIEANVMIVDHIDRIEHGEGRNSYHELTQTMRLCTELADECGLHLIVFSQLNRNASIGDRLAKYQPPQMHHLFGGSVKEHEADVVLGINRPLRFGAAGDALKAARTGQGEVTAVLEPNCMQVTVLKHRLRGEQEGRRCFLAVHHGRLSDFPERDLHTTARIGA
jgi:replicative DNA helicase